MNESNLKTLEQFLGTPINPKALEEVKKAVSRETGWPECELVCEVDDRGIVTVSRETDKAEEQPAYIDSSIYDFIQDSVYEELAENFRTLLELPRYSPDFVSAPVVKPNRITGEGRFHMRGRDKVGRNLKEKKRIARKQKKLGRRRNRRT